MLQLLTCTRFKTLRVMEDKVASMVCNLVLNIMYTSLMIIALSYARHVYIKFDLPQLMASNVSQRAPVVHLKIYCGSAKVVGGLFSLPSLSCMIGFVPCWPFLWLECGNGGICIAPWASLYVLYLCNYEWVGFDYMYQCNPLFVSATAVSVIVCAYTIGASN